MHNLGFMSQLTQNGSFHVDIFHSQSAGLVLKKLNLTLQKQTTREQNGKLEAKDVLRNINCTQAIERAKNVVFVPGDPDL